MNPTASVTHGVSLFHVSQPPDISYVTKHYYGDGLRSFQFTGHTGNGEDDVLVSSGTFANPSFKTSVPVAVTPPPTANPEIIQDIEVGLLQTARDSSSALYKPNLSSQLYIAGQGAWAITMPDWYNFPRQGVPVLPDHSYGTRDNPPWTPPNNGRNTFWPWYATDAQITPLHPDEFTDLSMRDAPSSDLPRYFNSIQQLPLLLSADSFSFNLYLAARTTQEEPQFLPMTMFGTLPYGLSNKLYYSEAVTNWQLILSTIGGAGGFVGNVGGSVSRWRHEQTPYLPDVNVVPANVGVNAPYGSWE